MATFAESTENRSALENLDAAAKSYAAAKIQGEAEIEEAQKNLAFAENQHRSRMNGVKLTRDRAVYAANTAGVAVTKIASVLGIKNRASIYATIERLKVPAAAVEIQTPSTTGTPTVENVPNTRAGRPGWLLTWSDGGSVEVYRKGDGELTAIGAGRDRWLADPTLAELIKEAP